MIGLNFTTEQGITTAGNIGLAIWRLKCFYETFVQGSTVVVPLNFCAKNPPHRQAENRWASVWRSEKTHVKTIQLQKEL